jgi:hypothetical protein
MKGIMMVSKHNQYLEYELQKSVTAIAELTKRVATIESMLLMAGIIERLDMSDIISVEDNDPWSKYSNTHYKVKKVNE